MKIKTKKQMNLPQLIEWLLKSGHRNYTANSDMGNTVTLSGYGAIQFSPGTFFPEETFTVEVETEITEDTIIPRIVEIDLCGYDQHEDVFMQENKSINQILNEDEVKKRAFYILNDDLTMTLIWRDGKLVA